jgi:hypothetical protein
MKRRVPRRLWPCDKSFRRGVKDSDVFVKLLVNVANGKIVP